MSKSIVLSVAGNDHTFTFDRINEIGEEVYSQKTGPLLGRMRIRARVKPNAAGTVNRVTYALDVPKVVDGDPLVAGTQPKVQFVQAASGNYTVFLGSESADREFLHGLHSAFVAHADAKAMVTDGQNLSA